MTQLVPGCFIPVQFSLAIRGGDLGWRVEHTILNAVEHRTRPSVTNSYAHRVAQPPRNHLVLPILIMLLKPTASGHDQEYVPDN